MHDYTDYVEKPTETGFTKLDAMIRDMLAAQEEVDEAETALKKAQFRLRDVSERQIPELMDEMGLSDFTTRDGLKVEIKRELRHSLAGDRKFKALAWLEENGHGDIIRRAVSVQFMKGEEDQVERVMQALKAAGVDERAELDRSVHASTLKALLKQLMAEGVEVPLETFGAFDQRTTKIKRK